MRSCSFSYGFDLTEKPTNTEDNVTSRSRQSHSSISSTSSVSAPSFNQRKHVVKELVKTQADFVLDMKNVLTAFDSVNLKVTESNRYSLLGNLDQLVHVSDAISMEFQKEISGYSDDRLGDACIAQCMSSFKPSINEALKTYILNFSVDASTKNPEIQTYSMLGLKIYKMNVQIY
uniref:SJCHGC03620 protein n=1 Tax=Schistosoma japonicum TaxID=6182 RepID=Q5DAW5_SCHJA|nr:SJCHGC03620 protein [Schistosoma japonicum]